MKLSPLQLLEYFVAEFHFTLNTRFDASKPLERKLEELQATPKCDKQSNEPHRWTVALDLKYQPAVETNTPYIISLTLVGVFEVAKDCKESLVQRLVQTNGPSVLYGIARELIREQTARGPDGPFIIPTASFVPDEPPSAAPAPVPPASAATPVTPAVEAPAGLTETKRIKPGRAKRVAPNP